MYKVAVYAPAERADTLTRFHLYPYSVYPVVSSLVKIHVSLHRYRGAVQCNGLPQKEQTYTVHVTRSPLVKNDET
jgi:hypothetical protein